MLIKTEANKYLQGKLTPLDSAVEAINAILEEASNKNENVLFLLSGGSSLSLLERIDTSLFNEKFTIAPLDERYSINPEENNMAQIAATLFFQKAVKNGVGVIDTRVKEGESQENYAERFNNDLINWFTNNPDGKVIATVGIGPDGHLAGIMPYPENPEFFNNTFNDGSSERLAVGYDAGDKNEYPFRVTTTMNLIRKIDVAIVYAVGDNKRKAVSNVLSENGNLSSTPARILREIPGKALLFIDQN